MCVCMCVTHMHINLIAGNICLVGLSGKSSGLTDYRPLFRLICFPSVILDIGLSTLFSRLVVLSVGSVLSLSGEL